MKRFFTTILLLMFGFIVNAQELQINGNVISATDQETLPGVSVVVKGTTQGTSTDFDGNYSISVASSDAVLVFSFMGMRTKEVVVKDGGIINVELSEDSALLEDIVVIGYGTQIAGKVSGAVSTVNKKAVEALQPVRAEDALQGQATGVNVIGNGSPGGKPVVLIRGIPSYTGTDPLVVIDGVTLTLDDLNALNPNDIESMNVLKDAAMSAIYGVKGGNGVIVIKTKSGKRNAKTTFGFDSSYGIQEVTNTVDVLNASEYAAILNEASSNAGQGLVFDDISNLGRGTDWQKEVLVNAPISTVNFTASGGSDKSSFYLSAGYLSQEGIVGGGDKSYFNRGNVTLNYNTSITDKLTFIANTGFVNIQGKSLSENNIGSVLSNALNFDPMVKPYDENGKFGTSETITQEIKNPLAQIDDTHNENNTNKVTGKLELQYDVIDGLKFTTRLGYSYVDVYSKNFNPLVYYGVGHNSTNAHEDLSPIVTEDEEGVKTSTHNRVSESKTNYISYTWELYGNYNFNIDEMHNFETVLGLSMNKNSGDNVTANAQDIPFNSWDYADVGAATGDLQSQTSGSWQYVTRNMSYFTRINYDFDSKYLFSFTGRVDGSTSFGQNNKFAFFPSGSLGWVISKEDFFESEFIDNLKVRGSYGSVGNDNIPYQFPKISTFPKYTFDGNIVSGSSMQSIPNYDVSWESQVQVNVGVDLTFYNNKFNITTDYFQKTVDDLLFSPTLSLYLGEPINPPSNIGKTKSSGFEFSFGYNDTYSNGLQLSTNVNVTTTVNNVEEINNGDKFIWGSGYGIPWKDLTRFEEGFSPGYFYGYKTDGIFQNQDEIDNHATQDNAQPGDIRFADVNKDGVINADDRTKIGDPFPNFTLGWTLSLNYQNWDFSTFIYASVGGDIYRAYERNLNYTNRFASTLGRWTGEGTSNTEPRVTFVDNNDNIRPSDRYVEDGSYARIKNIQLGYTLPQSIYNSSFLTSVRFYAQIKNAYTFTNYSGYSPEISSGVMDTGIDRGTYPQPRVWQLGVSVKF